MIFNSETDTRFQYETGLFMFVCKYKRLLSFKIETKANEAIFSEILLNLAHSFQYETDSKCHTGIC